MLSKMKNKKGFTLIELMIVVAIIGILAAIAIPNFMKYQAKSRQSEAKTNLKAIFTSEKAYYAENAEYEGNLNTIGYAPESGARYGYSANGGTNVLGLASAYSDGDCPWGGSATTDTDFSACATGNIDADTTIDGWGINDSNDLNQGTDDV